MPPPANPPGRDAAPRPTLYPVAECAAGDALAWSETVLDRAAGPAIALWRPKGVAVAIGVGQSSGRDILPEAIRRDGAALVRRASGGGSVVLCEGVLCWEAWADCGHVKRLGGDGGIRAAYAVLSLPVVEGLSALGVEAFRAGVCDIAASVDGTPRKLAGTAQLRRRNRALVHGSLLVDADLALLGRYLPNPESAPEYRAGRGHSAFCANVADLLPAAVPDSLSAVAAAVAGSAASLGWDILIPPEALPPEAETLARGKYRNEAWNWNKDRSGGS